MKAIKTIAAAAKFARVDPSTVKRALKRGLVKRKAGVFNPAELIAGVHAQAARRGGRQLSDAGGMPAELVAFKKRQAEEELKLLVLRCREVEHRLGLLDGKYVLFTDVTFWVTNLFNGLRDAFHHFPDQCALPCSMKTPQQVAAIVRHKLSELQREYVRRVERADPSTLRSRETPQ